MKNLTEILADICVFAQEHIGDPQAWEMDSESRRNRLQCTSYTIACFLAQNTVHGDEGVEYDVILDDLVFVPLLSIAEHGGWTMNSKENWMVIINDIVDALGGWKNE